MKVNEGNFTSANVEVGLTPAELTIIELALRSFPTDFDSVKEKVNEHMGGGLPMIDSESEEFTDVTTHMILSNLIFLDGKIHYALGEFLKGLDVHTGMYEEPDGKSKLPFHDISQEQELEILEELLNNTDFGEKIEQIAQIDPHFSASVMTSDGEMVNLGNLKKILSHFNDDEYQEIDDE